MAKKLEDLRKQKSRRRLEAFDRWMTEPTYGANPVEDKVRPKGRAPRGKGQEYADRRWIANRIRAKERNLVVLSASLEKTKGKSTKSYVHTMKLARARSLSDANSAARKVATGPGEWWFKRELIGDIYAVVGY